MQLGGDLIRPVFIRDAAQSDLAARRAMNRAGIALGSSS